MSNQNNENVIENVEKIAAEREAEMEWEFFFLNK